MLSGPARLRGQQSPHARHSLQLLFTPVRKGQARTRDEIADGARDNDFASAGGGGTPSRDVDRDPRQLGAQNLALTCVQTRPNCQTVSR